MPKQKEKYICLTKKIKIMKLENELLEKFQVEELEKRYEFYWIDNVEVGGSYDTGHGTITAKVNIPLNG